jgi:threonine dehydratase
METTLDHTGIITPERIAATLDVIRNHVRRTPVVQLQGREIGIPDVAITLKLELLQHAGSFKARGAFTNLLTRDIPAAGVVAASGGNHGAGVAYAASQLGIPASIFVPTISSPAKVDRIRSYGAHLVVGGDRYDDALAASEEFAAQSAALKVHAFDQEETLLGQGTVGVELESQAPELDTVLVAVGGGGLIGGIAAWYRGRVKVIGVEPEEAPTLARALDAGHPVDVPVGGVAADSLGARRIGERVFPIAQRYVDHALLVTDDEIRDAQRKLWSLLRIAAEPGGSTAFSALVSGRYRPQPGERVGVVVSGGNTTAVDFNR